MKPPDSKLGIDATKKLPGDSVNQLHRRQRPNLALRDSIQQMVRAGVVVVAAASNNSRDLAGPDGSYGTPDDAVPAAYTEALAVSAMDPTINPSTHQPNDIIWGGSNFKAIPRPIPTNNPDPTVVYPVSNGGAIDVAAPGVNILTTAAGVGNDGIGHDYAYQTGTSFAAPHVTGLVALYIAANGRAHDEKGVYKIRQAIIDASLPQSQWHTNNTHDPDTNPEPLAIATETWVPPPLITGAAGAPGNFQVSFAAVPGYDYTVQSAIALTTPISWTNLVTVSGTNFVAPVSLTDTNAASQSFYQLSRTPSP